MDTKTMTEKTRLLSSRVVLLLGGLVLGALIVGCSGSDGLDGAPGATGEAGPAGIGVVGPAGPAGAAGAEGVAGAIGAAAPLGVGSAGLTGTLLKGKISLGTVTAYGTGTGCAATNPQSGTPPKCNLGAANTVVSTTSAVDGTYTLQFPSSYTGPIILEIVGGTYINEADGTLESGPAAATPMRAILPVAPLSTVISSVAITPFTTMAAARAISQAGTSAVTTLVATQANNAVQVAYGIADIVGTTPVDVTQAIPTGSTGNAQQYGLLTAAFAQQAITVLGVGADPLAFVNAVASDFGSDGVLDGKASGVGITAVGVIGAPAVILTSTMAASGLVTAASTLALTVPGITVTVVDAAVAAATNAAHTTTLATSQLSYTTVNNGINVADTVIGTRLQGISSITGTTATMTTVPSFASGSLTVTVPFATVDGTLTSTVPFIFSLCPTASAQSVTCSTTDARRITVTLSKLTIQPSGANAIVSIPSDSRVTFTGTSAASAAVVSATPLLPGTIFTVLTTVGLTNQLIFNPNSLIAASTNLAGMLTAGNFTYTLVPGIATVFRSSGTAVTCTQADVTATACASVTLLKGPLSLL